MSQTVEVVNGCCFTALFLCVVHQKSLQLCLEQLGHQSRHTFFTVTKRIQGKRSSMSAVLQRQNARCTKWLDTSVIVHGNWRWARQFEWRALCKTFKLTVETAGKKLFSTTFESFTRQKNFGMNAILHSTTACVAKNVSHAQSSGSTRHGCVFAGLCMLPCT